MAKDKFEELYGASAEELEAKKLPGKKKAAKRTIDSFLDDIQYEKLEDLHAEEEAATLAFVKGDKEAFRRLVDIRRRRDNFKTATRYAEEIRDELFSTGK